MKRSSLLNFCLCLLVSIGMTVAASAQQSFKTTSASVIGYLEYLPNGYHQSSGSYPLVLFLHGKGEKAPNTRDKQVLSRSIKSVKKLGPPHYVEKGTKFPFILISPQLKSGYGDWPLWYIMEVLEYAKKTLRVDPNRIYLTGLSLGGGGVWKAAEDRPEIFAAVAPVCGSWNTISKAKAIADRDLPVWAFHGDKDNVVPWSRTKRMVDEINRYKPNPRAKFTTYRGVRHDAWTKAYRPDHSVHKPNVYEWLMSQSKNGGSNHQEQQHQEQEQKTNKLPVLNAGSDRYHTTDDRRIELVASASDPDGKIVKYNWSKISGGGVTLSGSSTSRLVLTNFSKGTYVFRLTVTDNNGGMKADNVRVHVREGSAPALRAIAGPDRYLKLPMSYYTVSGGAVSRDGNIVSYEWRQIDGPSLKLGNTRQRVLKMYDIRTPGRRTFVLTVRDSKGRIASDHVRFHFEESATRAASMEAAVLNGDPAATNIALSEEGAGDMSDSKNWGKSHVTVFSDRGERIFSGEWDESKREQVFHQQGLYIYQLTNRSQKTSGKIMIRQ